MSPKIRSAFSLIETVMATMLVSLLLVVSLNTLAYVTAAESGAENRSRAAYLSHLLLTEVSSKQYASSTNNQTALLGPEANELLNPRKLWDDCDDYDGLLLSPITDPAGKTIPASDGWRARFDVEFVEADNPAVSLVANNTDSGLKRIRLFLTDPLGHDYRSDVWRSKYGRPESTAPGSAVLGGIYISVANDVSQFQGMIELPNRLEKP